MARPSRTSHHGIEIAIMRLAIPESVMARCRVRLWTGYRLRLKCHGLVVIRIVAGKRRQVNISRPGGLAQFLLTLPTGDGALGQKSEVFRFIFFSLHLRVMINTPCAHIDM